jgi:hypothetical protein
MLFQVKTVQFRSGQVRTSLVRLRHVSSFYKLINISSGYVML